MKYGLISDIATFAHLTTQSLHNIGDNVQSHGVEHLYRHMGVADEQIVRLNRYEFRDYDGRHGYVLMPMCAYFTLGNAQSPFPLSPFIIPVYFSFGLSSDVDEPALLQHFRNHQPIGTRDERVMDMFRQRGVEAYLSGCVTMVFPKRQRQPTSPKVFLVDVPDALLAHIPAELLAVAERVTHLHPYQTAPADQAEADRLDQLARDHLQRYADEATLVVTARLHCAAPCLAMGIPTIVVAHNISDRFAWLDRFVPIHTAERFADIDWNPVVPDLEPAKQLIREAAIEQIDNARRKVSKLSELSAFYQARERSPYNNLLVKAVRDLVATLDEVPRQFAFWGATTHGVRLARVMAELYPTSQLTVVVDEYVQADAFCGVPVRRSDVLAQLREAGVFVFVATFVGRDYATQHLSEEGVPHGCLFSDLLTYHALS